MVAQGVRYDCSGLVMMAYRAARIDIPCATFQQVLAGTPVYSLSQLEPGDLLFTVGSDGTPTDPDTSACTSAPGSSSRPKKPASPS